MAKKMAAKKKKNQKAAKKSQAAKNIAHKKYFGKKNAKKYPVAKERAKRSATREISKHGQEFERQENIEINSRLEAENTMAGNTEAGREILQAQSESDEKQLKRMYLATSALYAIPGQISLVVHGAPFHLITHPFVRFHAVQSTIIGWKFCILYALFAFFAAINAVFFSSGFFGIIVLAFLLLLLFHMCINLYLAINTAKGKANAIPIMGEVARRISLYPK